jgi:hypothetical protein
MILQALIVPCATAVLVRRRMSAAHAARIGQILVKRHDCFQTQLGFPKGQEIVPIAETFSGTQLKVTQADQARVFSIRAKCFPMNAKLVQIEITPTEGQL